MQIERDCCVKYFDLGDPVQIVDGKYRGECAMVMAVDEDAVHMPLLKLDSSAIEVKINTRSLKMRDLRNSDNLATRPSRQSNVVQEAQSMGTSQYKVGDLLCYDNSKVFGHVIRVESDSVQVVNDRDVIDNVKPH